MKESSISKKTFEHAYVKLLCVPAGAEGSCNPHLTKYCHISILTYDLTEGLKHLS